MCNVYNYTDQHLEQLVTQFAKTLPPKLFIQTKQLKILESVGQGLCVIYIIIVIMQWSLCIRVSPLVSWFVYTNSVLTYVHYFFAVMC